MSQYRRIDDADWSFLTDEHYAAILAGARDAYHDQWILSIYEKGDLEQDALLYAATHRRTIERIESMSLLRRHIYSRTVRDHKLEWKRARDYVSLDELTQDKEDDD